MFSKKSLFGFLFLFSLIRFGQVHSGLTKVADFIYEDENGSFLMYEKPWSNGKFSKFAKRAYATSAAMVFCAGILANSGLVETQESKAIVVPAMASLALVSGGAALLSSLGGIVGSIDSFTVFIRRNIWGHMIAIGKDGFFHWNSGFMAWKDIEAISTYEAVSYMVIGTGSANQLDSNHDVDDDEVIDITTTKLRFIMKGNSDEPGGASWIRDRIQHPDVFIPLSDIPMPTSAFITLVNKFWNDNKASGKTK